VAVIDDIMDQAALTEAIVGPVETEMETAPFLGEQIAPMADTDDQYASMRVEDLHATGIGQFRAAEASIPLMDVTGREVREEVIELAFLDEGHRISPRRWEILTQGGDILAKREARNLVEIGQILERRNERLTEWMRWQAFSGQLTIEYEYRDSALVIDYPLPSGHKPAAAIPWTVVSDPDPEAVSDPVNDLRTWLQTASTSAGAPARRIHISDEDAELIVLNQRLPGYFNVEEGQPFMPTLDDVLKLLPPNTQFVPMNSAYRETSVGASTAPGDHTRFLPLGKVLITTDYSLDGLPIADTLNGPVEIRTGVDTTTFLAGPQSEIILKGEGVYTRVLRQASRRIVRLRRPEAFLYASVRA
jgi:Phage major capsid protein E